MKTPVLDIQNLQVSVEDKIVLKGFDLVLEPGEVVALVGPNGSGKSSLAMTLLGDSRYKITGVDSKIFFADQEISKLGVDERSRMGLFVSWQAPLQIPGITVFSLCRETILAQSKKVNSLVEFRKQVEELAEKVGLGSEYVKREVNVGFSGGERKRLEMLQLLLITPKVAVLDELDSGLDISGVDALIKIIGEMKVKGTSFILITHNQKLIDQLEIEKVWKTTS
jgi:Fe-S cluster assembly ATP-binding protein